MNRKVGIARLQSAKSQNAAFDIKILDFREERHARYQELSSAFRNQLLQFISKYGHEITENPELKRHFVDLCLLLNIDPLHPTNFQWSSFFKPDSYYVYLANSVLSICITTRPLNGGILSMEECLMTINHGQNSRNKEENSNHVGLVTASDIHRAISDMSDNLGHNNIRIHCRKLEYHVTLKEKKKWCSIILSAPCQWTPDQLAFMELGEQCGGCVTYELVFQKFKWNEYRTADVAEWFIISGMVWIEKLTENILSDCKTTNYWFPSVAFCNLDLIEDAKI